MRILLTVMLVCTFFFCSCKPLIEGRQCDRCAPGYYRFPNCVPCVCNEGGVTSEVCHPDTGRCLCKVSSVHQITDSKNVPLCTSFFLLLPPYCCCHVYREMLLASGVTCVGKALFILTPPTLSAAPAASASEQLTSVRAPASAEGRYEFVVVTSVNIDLIMIGGLEYNFLKVNYKRFNRKPTFTLTVRSQSAFFTQLFFKHLISKIWRVWFIRCTHSQMLPVISLWRCEAGIWKAPTRRRCLLCWTQSVTQRWQMSRSSPLQFKRCTGWRHIPTWETGWVWGGETLWECIKSS